MRKRVLGMILLLTCGGLTNTYASTKPSVLPGVMPVDVYQNLEKRGWKCTRPHYAKSTTDVTKLDRTTTTFDCFSSDKLAYAVAWGTTASNLTSVSVQVTESTNYGWLGFIATLPIDGVDQAAAQQWALDSVKRVKQGKPIVKTFGGIKYEVSGGGTARTLTINPF